MQMEVSLVDVFVFKRRMVYDDLWEIMPWIFLGYGKIDDVLIFGEGAVNIQPEDANESAFFRLIFQITHQLHGDSIFWGMLVQDCGDAWSNHPCFSLQCVIVLGLASRTRIWKRTWNHEFSNFSWMHFCFVAAACWDFHVVIPSRELTYPPKLAFWRWFSFSQGGIC